MSRYRLYLGPQQQEVDLLDNSRVSLSSQLKDHENLGKRKASTISGLKIVKNSKADKVLPSYFHVNSTLDAHSGVDGLLTYNGVELMKGKVYFKAITDKEFTCDLVNGIGSLAITLGDDLVKGNKDTSKDTKVDTSIADYSFVMNRDTVRAYQKARDTKKPYAFPLINYDGDRAPLINKKEYNIYPALSFLTLVEEVLKDAGFEYEIDPSIMFDLKRLYIPYNGPKKELAGNASLDVTTLFYNKTIVAYEIGSYTVETNKDGYEHGLAKFTSTTANAITNGPAGKVYNDCYTIPADGDYSFKLNAYGGVDDSVELVAKNPPYLPQPYNLIFTLAYLKAGTSDWKTVKFDAIQVHDRKFITEQTNTLTVTGLTEGDKIAIAQNDIKIDDNGRVTAKFHTYSTPSHPTELYIKCINYIYSSKVCTLDDILPRQYKKKDVIKDFMTMFNLYMISDHGVIKFVKYDNYLDKTKPPVDLTNKVDMKGLSIEDMVNRVPSNTVFTYTEANDKLSTDFKDKFGTTFGEGKYSILGKLSETTTQISLSVADTVIQKSGGISLPYAHIVKDKLTTEDKPRILYLNVKGITQVPWGADATGFGDAYRFSTIHYLSTEYEFGSLLFDNRYTYVEGDTVAKNSTLLNRYYKAELDHISDPSTKVVHTSAYLDNAYMGLDYMKRIYYIDLGPKGTFYGYINKMSGYSPDTGKAKLELVGIPNDPNYGKFQSTITAELVTYTPTDDGDQLSSSSASGTSSSGSSSTGNYYTKDEVNSKFLPLAGGKVTGDTTFEQDVIIHGDLSVLGTGTTVDLQTLEIESNELILNNNLGTAHNPYSGLSGVRVNRGNQADYLFQYDENSNLFKVGKQANLQAVATRQDNPLDNTIPYWSRAKRMYMSTGITYQHGTFVDNAGNYFYNNANSNKDYIPWHAQKILVGNGTLMEGLIQAKHLNGSYGTILSIDGARRALIGKSGVTQGVALFNGTTEVARTFAQGMIFPRNVDVDGEVKGSLFYTGEVSDLNDIKTNVFRGLEVMRYSQGASNKPVNSNNANGLLNIYSHGSGYGKQIAFGDSDDLYIRRMTAGSFGSWHKLYHDGNANNQNTPWRASFMRVQDQLVIRGTTTDDRLQLWGSQPYMSFYNEVTDHRDGYIQSHSGNMLIDVAKASNGIHFRVGGTNQAYVNSAGLNLPDGNVLQAYEKGGTNWNNYNAQYTNTVGALDVRVKNDTRASWIWSVRGSSNTFKAGFQISNNSNYSQLHLSPRLKVTAWDDHFEFYADGTKIAALDKDGNLRVKGTVQAHAL